MSETNTTGVKRMRRIRHTGRFSQVRVYLGKQLRFFINESDWKVLPMAAIIAGLVAMVIRKRFCVDMEGSLFGGFALTCVAIWNGCFNSIQAVCRERAIIKREHRSGMHISSYITAHMIYQFMLCAAQTLLTMFVLRQLDVQIPAGIGTGKVTPWAILDIGISMFLISYASDMMSLFLSSISRTTTGAMTLMPFILIFQLVFSGGIIPLPEWSRPISDFTISNYGVKAIVSQSDYNNRPLTSVWNIVSGMRDSEIAEPVTVGELLDLLDSPAVEKRRDMEVINSSTAIAAAEIAGLSEEEAAPLKEGQLIEKPVTLGEIADMLKSSEWLQGQRDKTYTVRTTVGELFDIIGEERVKSYVQEKTAAAAYKKEYANDPMNIIDNWFMLCVFIAAFAMMATIVLELIDKDRR